MSERKTEQLIRELLTGLNYYDDEGILVEEQKSEDPEITKLLKGAGKAGKGGKGAPEFIITSAAYPDLVVVIECKAHVADHQSTDLNHPVAYAVDGAIHYAKHLSKRYNVIAIGASGQDDKELKLSAYLIGKGAAEAGPLLDSSDQAVERLEELKTLHDYASRDPEVEKRRVSDLMGFARELHNFMRDYAKLSEAHKPLLISGILIALHDKVFRAKFGQIKGEHLPKHLTKAIDDVIEEADIPQAKKAAMLQPYSFIAAHPILGQPMKGSTRTPLQQILADIDEHVFPFITKVGEDIVGRFYGEFLRYTGGDGKGLGIVLTPRHVTELFCDLADLSANDVVLDTCCGTAGFLISAMHRMLNLPGVSERKRAAIKAKQLVGVEQQPEMYALAASNMILRGDGKANLFQSSSFESDTTEKVMALRPTVGFINPPYSQKGGDLHEFNFIEHMLDCLQPNGIGIAIVPLGCAVGDHPLKSAILKKHTLEAVMSMPEKLFYPVGTVTCIMVFRAHRPHAKGYKTWLALWKDDGHIQTKANGRSDYHGRWADIRAAWLAAFRNREDIAGMSTRQELSGQSEWCAEAFLEIDYSAITAAAFERELKKFFLFQRKRDSGDLDELDAELLLETSL